ncbi:thioesterase family protein [Caldifermentibacillus hisashii]|uniref:acyl-CoA thioesterase n=1 Tax=Caldifermentibacillus hisashii TaxID=996558 RepID=UPI0034396D14
MKNIFKVKVYFGDTDAAGIVFYPNFYRWMDQATAELVGCTIMPTSKLYSDRNILLPLLETHCQHRLPLFYEDIVEIHSEVTEIKNKVLKVEHTFKRNDEVVAFGYEIRAWTTKQEGRLKAVPIPEDVKEAFGYPVNH